MAVCVFEALAIKVLHYGQRLTVFTVLVASSIVAALNIGGGLNWQVMLVPPMIEGWRIARMPCVWDSEGLQQLHTHTLMCI